MTRFRLRIDPVWRPLMLPFGVTTAGSYADVTDNAVTFHFGPLFNRTIPRDKVEDVYHREWPWWMGIGWRSNLRGVIGLIGSTEGVVEIKLSEPSRAWIVFPCDRIAISLEQPEAFIAALRTPVPAARNGGEAAGERPIRRSRTRSGGSHRSRGRKQE